MSNGAVYISDSKNRKIARNEKVDATYASIDHSCPDSCELKKGGCYAKQGYTGIIARRLSKQAEHSSAMEIAKAEAKAIDESYNGGSVPDRNIRIHVLGDSRTVLGTRLINKAIERWKKRGGKIAWSYTHAWKKVPRKEWSNVSILASVSNTQEVKQARKQGYAPAIIVGNFKNKKAFKLPGSDVTWIPCPAQTHDQISCTDCKLCFKSEFLFNTKRGIAFEAHGACKNEAKVRLKIIK